MKLYEHENNDDGILLLSSAYDIEEATNIVFFLKIEYTGKVSKEWEQESGKYHVSVGCVSIDSLPENELPYILENNCIALEQWNAATIPQKSSLLVNSFGPIFWQRTGNNITNLTREAKSKLENASKFFNDHMDLQQNACGATGWDWIRGNTSPIKKLKVI